VLPKLIRRVFLLLIAAAYIGATLIAATLPIGSCHAVDDAAHSAHHHHSEHGSSHYPNGSGSTAGECLKCCLGAYLVAPGLPGPNIGLSQLASIEIPVRYWGESSPIIGHPVAPDPGPPKPIT
jgi:hypothetical protein